MTNFRYSVIIISLNEDTQLKHCVRSVKNANKEAEIILSDGGSTDLTQKIARKEELKIVNSTAGRGTQFNEGVKLATGDIFIFLHADTVLPDNAFNIMDNFFSNKKINAGTFKLNFNKENAILTFYSKFTTLDSIFTRFGDQCIVLRKEFYYKLGGFNNWPIFEDVDLLRRARKLTRIYSFPATVVTSSRRFETTGIIKQQLLNFLLIILYLVGISPDKLASIYYNKSQRLKGYKKS